MTNKNGERRAHYNKKLDDPVEDFISKPKYFTLDMTEHSLIITSLKWYICNMPSQFDLDIYFQELENNEFKDPDNIIKKTILWLKTLYPSVFEAEYILSEIKLNNEFTFEKLRRFEFIGLKKVFVEVEKRVHVIRSSIQECQSELSDRKSVV